MAPSSVDVELGSGGSMATTASGSTKQVLMHRLGRIESVIAKLQELEREHHEQQQQQQQERHQEQQQQNGDEDHLAEVGEDARDDDSGGRQSSSGGVGPNEGDEGKVDAFTKERSAVGARMTVASSSSDMRPTVGHKRDMQEAGLGAVEPSSTKRPKVLQHEDRGQDEEQDSLSDQSLSRRVDRDAVSFHSSEEASSQHYGGATSRDLWERCAEVVASLVRSNKEAWVFNQPVQVLWPNLHDYDKIIKTPMDLGTVSKRIEGGFYRSTNEFARDVRLTFSNAMQYNKAGSLYHNLSRTLLRKFDRSFKALENSLNRKPVTSSYVETFVPAPPPAPAAPAAPAPAPTPAPAAVPSPATPAVTYAVEHRTTVEIPEFQPQPEPEVEQQREATPTSAEIDIPEIKGLNPRLGRQANTQAYGGLRKLSEKEKAKLSELIETFPADRMSKVLEILKSTPDVLRCKGDGEWELDLEKLDEPRQFELFRLAMNWQKSKNKFKKPKMIGGELVDASQRPGTTPTPRGLQPSGWGISDKEEIDIGGSSPQQNGGGGQQQNGGEQPSSSSDSGSSSDSSSSSGNSSSSSSSDDSDSEGEAESAG